jgi:prepilin signal peptidase PulO-like enzyme (type II secretory pathway)
LTTHYLLDNSLFDLLPWPFLGLFLFYGAALGSFFNVLSLRFGDWQIERNDSQAKAWLYMRGIAPFTSKSTVDQPQLTLLGGRSHCPDCRKAIPLYLNIPLFSWLLLLGTSKCCRKPISIRYIAFELIGALVFAGIAATIPANAYAIALGTLLMLLILIAAIDAKDGLIPEGLVFAALIISLALAASSHHWVSLEHALALAAGIFVSIATLFSLIGWLLNRPAMGFGDFTLLAVCASLVGFDDLGKLLALTVLLLVPSWCLYKHQLIARGRFVAMVNPKAVPAGPSIVAATIVLVALRLAFP